MMKPSDLKMFIPLRVIHEEPEHTDGPEPEKTDDLERTDGLERPSSHDPYLRSVTMHHGPQRSVQRPLQRRPCVSRGNGYIRKDTRGGTSCAGVDPSSVAVSSECEGAQGSDAAEIPR